MVGVPRDARADPKHHGQMIQALFLTRYGYEAASARQRFFQFVDPLRRSGIECRIRPFFWDGYLAHRFAKKRPPDFYRRLASSYCRRILMLRQTKSYDVVVVQTELLPYMPVAAEAWIPLREVPFVYDFDDAWFHHYQEHRSRLVRQMLGSKIARIMGNASAVTVGSSYLAQYARNYQDSVTVVPTSIDLAHYPKEPPRREAGAPFTIGWTGSPSTASYLESVLEVLRHACKRHNARVVIIGSGRQSFDIPNVTYADWNEKTEIEMISAFDVGIMPLPDSPFTRGKCAFKLIQYMGCWKPVIGSPVGENNRVIEPGRNGFFASSHQEWLKSLEVLIENPEIRRAMGLGGRRKIEEKYSKDIVAPRFEAVLRSVAESHDRSHAC